MREPCAGEVELEEDTDEVSVKCRATAKLVLAQVHQHGPSSRAASVPTRQRNVEIRTLADFTTVSTKFILLRSVDD